MNAAPPRAWEAGYYGQLGRRWWTMSSVYYAMMLTYRVEIMLWAVATALPLIMMGVWAQAGASGKFNLDQVQMVRYFIAVFVIRQLTVVWVIHDFDYQVISGKLSPLLLQPVDPGWRFVTMHIGEQWSRWPFAAAMVGMCFVLYPSALWGNAQSQGPGDGLWLPPWWQVVLAVAACYCAFALRFLMQYSLAMGAFWFERVAAFHQLIFLPYLFLSGLVFPLQELPAGWLEVFLLTPFPYMVWFPASLLIDQHVPTTTIVTGFVVMGVWTAFFYMLNRWLWRRGLRHYAAMGA